MVFIVKSPASNVRGPIYVEAILKSIHQANFDRRQVHLLFRAGGAGACLGVSSQKELLKIFKQELLDNYPGLNIEYAEPFGRGSGEIWSRTIRVSPDLFRLQTYEQSEDELNRMLADPVAGILSSLRTGRAENLKCQVDFSIVPARRKRHRQLNRIKQRLEKGFRLLVIQDWYVRWATSGSLMLRLVALCLSATPQGRERPTQALPSRDLKATEQLFECWLTVYVVAPSSASEKAIKWLNQISGSFGRFSSQHVEFLFGSVRKGLAKNPKRGFLLTAQEISSIWHPPTISASEVARVRRSEFREIEPPVSFSSKENQPDMTVLGRVKFRNQKQQCAIQMDDLRRHLLVIGKTGCGKSTFLLNAAVQQIAGNRGLVLIDPHGQLAEDVLRYVPGRRINDVIVFNAGENEFPTGFNPLVGPVGSDPAMIADGVLTAFSNVFGFNESTAPRLLHIFRNSLLSLVGTPQASLLSVQRLLVDEVFRKSVVSTVSNPVVRGFWQREFNKWNERDRTLYIASLQNKLGAFLVNPRLQRIFCGGRKTINIRETLDSSKILVCNLSKGIVGHDASKLLGSLLLSSIHVAVMSRADLPENQRADSVVMVDEFHSYLSEGNSTLSDALAESRKYRASYVLSSQMLEQLDQTTQASVLGNCGSTLCMTVGPRDAEVLAEVLGHDLTRQDLMSIPKYHGYLRMLTDGTPKTFSIATLAPPRLANDRSEKIRKISKLRYGRLTKMLEAQLQKELPI